MAIVHCSPFHWFVVVVILCINIDQEISPIFVQSVCRPVDIIHSVVTIEWNVKESGSLYSEEEMYDVVRDLTNK